MSRSTPCEMEGHPYGCMTETTAHAMASLNVSILAMQADLARHSDAWSKRIAKAFKSRRVS